MKKWTHPGGKLRELGAESLTDAELLAILSIFYRQHQKRRGNMEQVRVWYDPEGDYLEVIFKKKEGYFRETESDQIMEKVDMEGNVIGFSILKVSSIKGRPLELSLA